MGLMSLQHEFFGITPFMSIELLLAFINKYYRSIMPFQPSWVSTRMPLNFNYSIVYSSIILLFSHFLCYCNSLKALTRVGSCSGFAFKVTLYKTNASLSQLVFWVKYSCSHCFQTVVHEGMRLSQDSDMCSQGLSEGAIYTLAGIARIIYLCFLWLGLVFSCSAIVLFLFHNSRSGFHSARIGAAPHILLCSHQGSGK